MMQLCLEIEHAPFVAPALDFFHAIAIPFGNAEFYESKRVFGKTRFAKTHSIAPARRKIRHDLAIQEIEERRFRIRISRGNSSGRRSRRSGNRCWRIN